MTSGTNCHNELLITHQNLSEDGCHTGFLRGCKSATRPSGLNLNIPAGTKLKVCKDENSCKASIEGLPFHLARCVQPTLFRIFISASLLHRRSAEHLLAQCTDSIRHCDGAADSALGRRTAQQSATAMAAPQAKAVGSLSAPSLALLAWSLASSLMILGAAPPEQSKSDTSAVMLQHSTET